MLWVTMGLAITSDNKGGGVMTVQKPTEVAGLENANEAINRIFKRAIDSVMNGKMSVQKRADIIEDIKVLASIGFAAAFEKQPSQSTSEYLDNSASKRPYLNSEGQYILLERTPEEIAKQAQSIRDMFTEWEREYDAEEQRETFAYLQKALRDDFPSEGLFSENPLSVSQ